MPGVNDGNGKAFKWPGLITRASPATKDITPTLSGGSQAFRLEIIGGKDATITLWASFSAPIQLHSMPRNWYYWSGNREAGPLTLQELNHIASQRRIGPETQLREGKDGKWMPASSVEGFFPSARESPGDKDGPPPIPIVDRLGSFDEARELDAAPNEQHRAYLYSGVAVCALLAVVAICMTLFDDSNRTLPSPHPNSVPETRPASAPLNSNWIARVKAKATRGVILVKTDEGFGSGFVAASRQGRNLIVTNKHVLVGEDFRAVVPSGYSRTYSVKSESGRSFTGRLVALAALDELDLALLLVQSSELETLGRIASMENVEVGDQVVAIGNPLDPRLANTVTNGIISAKHGALLQTNAAINKGNSGGPLVNDREEIIGVNTMAISKQFGEGIGFAIRADFITRKNTWAFFEDVSDLIAVMPR